MPSITPSDLTMLLGETTSDIHVTHHDEEDLFFTNLIAYGASVIFFSNFIYTFFGYFDPTNKTFDNKNEELL